MRLMYVALTRAKEQLILIGTIDKEETLEKLERLPISGNQIALHKRLSADRPFDLIYSILAKYQSTSLLPEYQFEKSIDNLDESLRPTVDIKIAQFEELSIEDSESEQESRDVSDLEVEGSHDKTLKQQINDQLSFKYPYLKDTEKPSKQSVSELKRQLETEESGTSYERVRQYRIGVSTYERPKFLRENKKRKANEIGTLMHTVMQHLPFKETRITETELNDYINELIEKHIIEEDAKKIFNLKQL